MLRSLIAFLLVSNAIFAQRTGNKAHANTDVQSDEEFGLQTAWDEPVPLKHVSISGNIVDLLAQIEV